MVEAELFHADERTDGQTDMTKLIFVFRKIASAPKSLYLYLSVKEDNQMYKMSYI